MDSVEVVNAEGKRIVVSKKAYELIYRDKGWKKYVRKPKASK